MLQNLHNLYGLTGSSWQLIPRQIFYIFSFFFTLSTYNKNGKVLLSFMLFVVLLWILTTLAKAIWTIISALLSFKTAWSVYNFRCHNICFNWSLEMFKHKWKRSMFLAVKRELRTWCAIRTGRTGIVHVCILSRRHDTHVQFTLHHYFVFTCLSLCASSVTLLFLICVLFKLFESRHQFGHAS